LIARIAILKLPSGQCYKTFYGRNYITIGTTQSKYADGGVIYGCK